MIYELLTIDVKPNKVKEFNEFWLREALPVWEKHGIKHIGSWVTLIGKSNEVIRLFEYKDLAHFEQWRQFCSEDEKWKATHLKIWEYVINIDRKILRR